MKGREDDRKLFVRGLKLNVQGIIDSKRFDPDQITQEINLAQYGLSLEDLMELKKVFHNASTLGSLIQLPKNLKNKLQDMKQLSEAKGETLFSFEMLKQLGLLVKQAHILSNEYDAVIANPPYMGSRYYNSELKKYVTNSFEYGKNDLYSAFTLRNILLAKEGGHIGMITIPNWMFLSSFEKFRNYIITNAPIKTLVHNGRGVWGSDFGSCSYVLERG